MSRCWNGAIAAFALVLAGWAGCRTASGQAVEPGAEPFALRDVRLGDGPFPRGDARRSILPAAA